MSRTRHISVSGALALAIASLTVLGTATEGRAAAPSCHGHPATIVMRPGQRQVMGTNHRDVIVGNGTWNEIRGRGGDDVICGGRFGDGLYGGKGDDHLYGGKGEDFLTGAEGDDVVVAGTPSAEHQNAVAEGAGDDRIVVSAYDVVSYLPVDAPPVDADLSTGTVTGQGTDQVTMPSGASIDLRVPSGSVVHGSPYRDLVFAHDSTLYGGGGNDAFFESGSEVHGNAGSDYVETGLTSGDRPTFVYGGTGQDFLDAFELDPGTEAIFDGGPGSNDSASVTVRQAQGQTTPYPLVDLDLASHLTVGPSTWPFTGFESVDLTVDGGVADAVSAEGTDGSDTLGIVAGDVPVTVHTLGGDDQVSTQAGDDLVDGGDGTDSADTAGGQDTCISVEQPTHCESVTP